MSAGERVRTPRFVLLLVAVASLLLALIIAPFAAAFFAAAVFASVMYPVQARVTSVLGDRPGLAAGVLTLGLGALVVAPLAGLCVFVVQHATLLFRQGQRLYREDGIDGLVATLPDALQDWAWRAIDYWHGVTPGDGEGASAAAADGEAARNEALQWLGGFETAADVAGALFESLAGILIELGVLLLTLFFLLKEGKRLVDWIVEVLPLSVDDGSRLVREFRDVTNGVFLATVVTAFLQTLIAAVGFWIAGVSYVSIALLLTFVCALIPIIGGAAVVIGAGVLLLLYGDTGYGVFLCIWGAVPVGLSDNIVKPLLAGDRLRLPGAVVMFAMMGGLIVFGPMGVVAGPLIVAFFLAALRLLRREESASSS